MAQWMEWAKRIGTLYLLFGILLNLPSEAKLRRTLRFCLSILLFSVILNPFLS